MNNKASNKDPRGVERGKCNKCPCQEYQLEEGSKRAACSYCECPAPSHDVITDASDLQDTSLTTNNSSISSDTSTPIILDVSCSDLVNQLLGQGSSISQPPEPTTDEIEGKFPKRFPKKVHAALQDKSLKATHKTTMVQKVVDNLYGHDLASNSCLEKAAKRMVSRWSPLKVAGDTKNRGLLDKMRRRRDRLNETGKKKAAEAETEDGDVLTPTQARDKLKELWVLGNRTASTFRPYIPICRNLRKDESKRLPGLQLLRAFPFFNIHDLVLEEFEYEMGMKTDTMETNWTKNALSLMKYMTEKKICVQWPDSFGEKTICILENLHRLSLWFKKTLEGNRAARVMEVFEATTPLGEMTPNAKDPPRLLVHGRDINASISCYLDTEPLFCVQSPVKALLLLLAAYFVLNIKFPPHTRLQLIVLSCCTVGANAANLNLDIARNNKLLDLLKELFVM